MRLIRFLCVLALSLAADPVSAAPQRSTPRPAAAAASALAASPVPKKPGNLQAEAASSTCQERLAAIAAFKPIGDLSGPGQCGATDAVSLEAILLQDKTRIPLSQPAKLRCSMAEGVALWVRDDMAAAAATLGSPLKSLVNFESYECRGQNRVSGAPMSEHGRANAFDIRGLKLANGTLVEFTSPRVSKAFRETLRKSACTRFTTVLGPGSDRYHEDHIHVDLAERRNHYRICHWDLREPPLLVDVPLPVRRPSTN